MRFLSRSRSSSLSRVAVRLWTKGLTGYLYCQNHYCIRLCHSSLSNNVSSLSKTLLTASKTIPDLEFNDEDLLPGFCDGRKRVQMYKKLEQIMKNRIKEGTYTRKFKLSLDINVFVDQIDRLICHAIKSKVKVVELFVLDYNLPENIFCAQSINVLELGCCNLGSKRIHNVKLSSLRKLILDSVDVDNKVMQNLVAGCPLIEYLYMEHCNGLERLELYGLTKLKKTVLADFCALQHVGIRGLNVQSVTINGTWDNISLEIDIGGCKNLKCVKLMDVTITDESFCNQLSGLTLLENLGIDSCKKLHRITISNPRLKALVVAECRNLVEVKIETPDLHLFRYGGEIQNVSFSSNILDLSEADIGDPSDFNYYMQYSALFQSTELSKVLKDCYRGRARLICGKIDLENCNLNKHHPWNCKWLVEFDISHQPNLISSTSQ